MREMEGDIIIEGKDHIKLHCWELMITLIGVVVVDITAGVVEVGVAVEVEALAVEVEAVVVEVDLVDAADDIDHQTEIQHKQIYNIYFVIQILFRIVF